MEFQGGSDSKESSCSAGDSSLISGLGRSLEEANGNPLQHSCLESSLDRGACRATVHGVTKSQAQLSDQHFHFSEDIIILREKSASIKENDLEQFKQRR